jgi:hypothetical protein
MHADGVPTPLVAAHRNRPVDHKIIGGDWYHVCAWIMETRNTVKTKKQSCSPNHEKHMEKLCFCVRRWDISVIHEDFLDRYSSIGTVKTLPRAKTIALDPKTHNLFLSTSEAGQFEVLVVGRS